MKLRQRVEQAFTIRRHCRVELTPGRFEPERKWRNLVLLALMGVGLCDPVAGQAAPPLDAQFYIAAQFTDAAGPAVRLANGNVFRVQPSEQLAPPHTPIRTTPPQRLIDQIELEHPGLLPPWVLRPGRPLDPRRKDASEGPAPARDAKSPARARSGASILPDARFIRVQDVVPPPAFEIPGLATRVRNQGSHRNSCTWFAATLGVEAAYLALANIDVRLSPQYFNNAIKTHLYVGGVAPPMAEVQIGLWGGGNLVTNLGTMIYFPFGLPEETDDPYTPFNNAVSGASAPIGDVLVENGALYTQRTVDEASLSDTAVQLANPPGATFTPLPVGALENATYGATAIEIAGGADLHDLDWFRRRISGGDAIVIQFACCGTHDAGSGGVWTPAGNLSFSHAAVLVGYDDTQQAFQLRNSWGENSARWFSYDFVTGSHVTSAVRITAIAPVAKPSGLPSNLAVVRGRWWLTDSNQPGRSSPRGTGLLDLYKFPTAAVRQPIGRIGSFFAENGQVFRVNGQFQADPANPPGRLDFYIDATKPDVDHTSTSGTHYTFTYMFETTLGNNHRMMVGTAQPPGGSAGSAVLRKTAPLPAAQVSALNAVRPANEALIGWWEVYWEGEVGSLIFTRFDQQTGNFVGTYQPFGGQRVNAWGGVNGNSIAVITDLPYLRIAIGGFADSTRSVAAGHPNRANPASAFVAMLRNPSPQIVIPAYGGTLGSSPPN